MALTVGSLFSGIGGIDLGLERAGMVTRWFVEWDAHCQNVLRRHWPRLPVYGDITAVDWSRVEPVDVLAGGFPCQPISRAGKQTGQDDARWLWPEFARAIRVLRPRYVLVENVPNLLAINDGGAMAEVLGDLAALGYDAEWDCIPAVAVGALHERDRLWIVAYANGSGGTGTGQQWAAGRTEPEDSGAALADADRHRPQALHPQPLVLRPTERNAGIIQRPGTGGRALGHGGVTGRTVWAAEPDVGRVADGVPHRVDRLRALGNAVVPQVVEWIGHAIVAFDEGRVAE